MAIACVLASNAHIILAEELAGKLDKETAAEITAILKEMVHNFDKCVVVVTHSTEVAKQADIVLRLKKGELYIEAK